MPQEVVIVTPGQPSTNPRLVKEAVALSEAGYQITVLYSYWTKWADEPDRAIIKKYPLITWKRVGGHPRKERLLFLFSRILFKTFKSLSKYYKSDFLLANSINRTSYFLGKAVPKYKANLYIAHYMGALPATLKAGKKHGVKVGFDFEDYYSGQWNDSSTQMFYKKLENLFLRQISFCTTASPLITEKYTSDFPFLKPVTIHNVFSKKYSTSSLKDYRKGDTLKLFWFSQTIGKARGLEEIISAIGKEKRNVTLSILGHCSDETKDFFQHFASEKGLAGDQLRFIDPVHPDDIFLIGANHHIGVAMETEETVNRNICLTNKIFTYLLCGLTIIANDTNAQKIFFEKYPEVGFCFDKRSIHDLCCLLNKLIEEPELVNRTREKALFLAKTELNWENEREKVITLVKENLS